MKLTVAFFIAASCLLPSAFADESAALDDFELFAEKQATRNMLNDLRKGGYVLFMRHGQTDSSRPDRVPNVDLEDCMTQRPLSEEGRRVAAKVGAAIRRARIPVGEVYSSPLCRATESTVLAFGKKYTVNNLLAYTSNMTNEEKAPIIAATRELLSRPVEGRVNRVLVAHAPNLMDIIGYFPKEGAVAIFKPLGNNQFAYLASVTAPQWAALLK